ncbi:MAG TPA: DUF1549 domain-containing protein, partial [Methylomirabilota bacterium]|nr:DUF1549 domain-containing protein [Methylomirabilota bacterium]
MALWVGAVAAELPPPVSRAVDFAKDVEPILAASCYSCHGSRKQESALRLDRKSSGLAGGELHGAAIIVPGMSADSILIQAVAHTHPDLKMPRKGDRLTAEQVGILRAWIDQGANWPDSTVVATGPDPREHWAFRPPRRPELPPVRNESWSRTPVDRFILARLEKEGLEPSPAADAMTLFRRLHLDLIGLPPTVEEADAFAADPSPEAYARVVERLLASPHYGERWGRHWLDAARYADSDGYEKDMSREIWPYRDYVIGAFNRDLPYDQFIIEQIAGDLLPNRTQDQLVATGFLR